MSAKRISDPAEIEFMIDRLKGLRFRRKERAAELDAKADKIYAKHGGPESWDKKTDLAKRMLTRADKFRRQAQRLRDMHGASDKRLRHLSLRWAELATGILPGVEVDRSVKV